MGQECRVHNSALQLDSRAMYGHLNAAQVQLLGPQETACMPGIVLTLPL